MSRSSSPLNNIRIASPCSADWEGMYGDGRKRFCSDCKLNVYNLSGMTRQEAEALIMMSEGSLCIRYYQRRDGTIITQDCPVGWARIKQRTGVWVTAAFSMVIALFTGVLFASLFSKRTVAFGSLPVTEHVMGAVTMDPAHSGQVPMVGTLPREYTMGKMQVKR